MSAPKTRSISYPSFPLSRPVARREEQAEGFARTRALSARSARRLPDALLRASGVAVFLLLWEAAPRLGWVDAQFAPAFSTVLRSIVDLAADGTLEIHLLVSLWRALLGLLVAGAIGVPAGFALGRLLPRLAEALDPFLRVLSQVNPFSLMPVFLLFFGIGETAKVAVIAWVSLWPVLFYTITGVRTVDAQLVKTASALAISGPELAWKVLLPGALPAVFVGLRVGAGLVFLTLVAAEMLGASAGLGWLVHNSAMNFQIPRIYAGATFLILLGFGLNRLLRRLEAGFSVWREPSTPSPGATPSPGPLGRREFGAVAAGALALLLLGGWAVHRVNVQEKTLPGHGTHPAGCWMRQSELDQKQSQKEAEEFFSDTPEAPPNRNPEGTVMRGE